MNMYATTPEMRFSFAFTVKSQLFPLETNNGLQGLSTGFDIL